MEESNIRLVKRVKVVKSKISTDYSQKVFVNKQLYFM